MIYALPFALYLTLTLTAGRLSGSYPLAYSAAVAVVGLATFTLLRGQQVLRPHLRVVEAVVFGLIGAVLWIALSMPRLEEALTAGFPSWLQPQSRVGFDPFSELSHPAAVCGFTAMRLIGLVILVPIAEEMFWRGFLLRWVISPTWHEAPLGAFSFRSFFIVTALFAAAHPEWLAAVVYCALLNVLLYWKKDLWSCVVAHAVSNLMLAIYVLATESWWLW